MIVNPAFNNLFEFGSMRGQAHSNPRSRRKYDWRLIALILLGLVSFIGIGSAFLNKKGSTTQLGSAYLRSDENGHPTKPRSPKLWDPNRLPGKADGRQIPPSIGKEALKDIFDFEDLSASKEASNRDDILPTNEQRFERSKPARYPHSLRSWDVQPRDKTALLIPCYNRPDYLGKTMAEVLKYLPRSAPPDIIISQDGSDAKVSTAIQAISHQFLEQRPDVTFLHVQHQQKPPVDKQGKQLQSWAIGYYRLSDHFKWALDILFNTKGYGYVIILEDDIAIAPDFFDYFETTKPLLFDPSILAISAWNDIGQDHLVNDPKALFRSDFFPGLGWMLDYTRWEELSPIWPEAFWDDWLREPPQRKDRHTVRPEISRTRTFGVVGVSNSEHYSYIQSVRLNQDPVNWSQLDFGYLEKERWDLWLGDIKKEARKVISAQDFIRHTCTSTDGGQGTGPKYSTSRDSLSSPYEEIPMENTIQYHAQYPMDYSSIAQALQFIDNAKAGVHRGAYDHTLVLKHNGCLKVLTYAPLV